MFRQKEACLFERAIGDPAWRHNENNILAGRPSRELVLRTAAAIGNYDYMMDWIFQQDGTIRVRVGATGIVEVKGSKDVVAPEQTMTDGMPTPQHGTLVAPNTVASITTTISASGWTWTWTARTTASWWIAWYPEKISARTRTSIWGVESTPAKTESQAILDIDPRKPAMWHFVSSTSAARWVIPRASRSCPRQRRLIFSPPMTHL